MNETEVLIVGLGVILVLVALFVELEHKHIWNHYVDHYHKHKNPTLEKLLKPNKWVYKLNVYLVWPIVIVLGVWLIIANAQ